EGDAQRAHPFAPVGGGLLEKTPSDFPDRTLHRLVRAEEQGDRVFQEEVILLHDRRDGRIRRESQHEVRADVADVVRAARDVRAKSSEQNAGSPSKRGKHAHTISPSAFTSAPIVPLPINPRSSEVTCSPTARARPARPPRLAVATGRPWALTRP